MDYRVRYDTISVNETVNKRGLITSSETKRVTHTEPFASEVEARRRHGELKKKWETPGKTGEPVILSISTEKKSDGLCGAVWSTLLTSSLNDYSYVRQHP